MFVIKICTVQPTELMIFPVGDLNTKAVFLCKELLLTCLKSIAWTVVTLFKVSNKIQSAKSAASP